MARLLSNVLPLLIVAVVLYLMWHYVDQIFMFLYSISEALSKLIP